jgi:hypothetical protein
MQKKCPFRKIVINNKEQFGDCIEDSCELWITDTLSEMREEPARELEEGCAFRLIARNLNLRGS